MPRPFSVFVHPCIVTADGLSIWTQLLMRSDYVVTFSLSLHYSALQVAKLPLHYIRRLFAKRTECYEQMNE